jgi:hypothetical protein
VAPDLPAKRTDRPPRRPAVVRIESQHCADRPRCRLRARSGVPARVPTHARRATGGVVASTGPCAGDGWGPPPVATVGMIHVYSLRPLLVALFSATSGGAGRLPGHGRWLSRISGIIPLWPGFFVSMQAYLTTRPSRNTPRPRGPCLNKTRLTVCTVAEVFCQ